MSSAMKKSKMRRTNLIANVGFDYGGNRRDWVPPESDGVNGHPADSTYSGSAKESVLCVRDFGETFSGNDDAKTSWREKKRTYHGVEWRHLVRLRNFV